MNAHPDRRHGSVVFSEKLESRVLFVRVEGIDVSQFQGVINWPQIATNNKQFVFMRASRTNLDKDPTFDTNLAGATAAGLLVGTYHYTLPNNFEDAGPPVDPVVDAQRYFAAAGHTMTTGYLPPVIDAEAAGPVLGKAAYSAWINAFSDEIFRLSGVRPIVYANINYAVNFIDESVAARHKLWLARYNNGNDPSGVDPQSSQPDLASFHPNPYGAWNVPVGGPRSDNSWRFWQYTSRGDGIATGVSSVNLDLDLYNGSYEELKKEFLIGYQKNFGTPDNNPFAVAPGATTVIQAENYDIGGDTISYGDTTPTVNTGGVFRTSLREGVDLAAVAGGDFAVADTAAGEFVEYTLDVAADGNYQLAFHVAQTEGNGAFHAEVDGVALPALVAPDTDGFDTFVATTQSAALTAGRHVIRVAFDTPAANGQVANLDRIEITDAPASPAPTPTPTPTAPPGAAAGATYVRGGTFARQNFGPTADLMVQRGRGSSNTAYAVLHFDLTNVATVASARLQLTGRLSDAALPSMQTNVYSVSKLRDPFNEHQVTFKNKPAGKKLRGSITVTGTSDAGYELDLTSFVQAELAAGRKTVTLVLRNVTRSVTTQTLFQSNETANPPVLAIT